MNHSLCIEQLQSEIAQLTTLLNEKKEKLEKLKAEQLKSLLWTRYIHYDLKEKNALNMMNI